MSDPPFVSGHRGQLQEVLLNLIYNAIEAMSTTNSAARMLQISTKHSDKDAIGITVEDTGPGIDPEKLSVIFDAFVSTKPHGMGLGLAICRMIIERHGGQLIALPSRKGGAFQVILPLNATDDMPRSPLDSDQVAEKDSLLNVQ
jgi:signal transduction histidine kinase